MSADSGVSGEAMDKAVEAFWHIWIEEGELPYMARIRDFSPGEGVASEEEWAAFGKAQEEADAKNNALIARCLEAALPVLLESGELVTKDEAQRLRDTADGWSASSRAQYERAARAERELADCEEGKAAFASAAVTQQDRADRAELALTGSGAVTLTRTELLAVLGHLGKCSSGTCHDASDKLRECLARLESEAGDG